MMDALSFALIWLIPGVALAAQMYWHSKQRRDWQFWAFVALVLLLGPLFFCAIVYMRGVHTR